MNTYKVVIRSATMGESRLNRKEMIFSMKLTDLFSCRSQTSFISAIKKTALKLKVLSKEELEGSDISCQELQEAWRSSLRVLKEVRKVRDFVAGRWTLESTHGISHWDRVYENGMKLVTDDVDPVVVQYFAYLHDSCREDDGNDRLHGERAADWIETLRETLLRHLTDQQFNKLQEACRYHTVMSKTGDATVDACFDADRLDLWRVGIKPDPERMATCKGAELAREITEEKMMKLLLSYSY